MNDNDIIKAMERCNDPFFTCEGCPLERAGSCLNVIKKYALDLINRQKAEIERLKAILEAAEDHYYPLPFKGVFNQKIDEAKTEAIKEYAERLKNSIDLYQCIEEYYENAELCYEVRQDWFCEYIDNLVKEMTEGE